MLLNIGLKILDDIQGTQKIFNHRANMCSLAAQGEWTEQLEKNKKFIYLISPKQIKNKKFYKNLKLTF